MIKLRILKLVLSSYCWYSTIFQLYFSHKRWQTLVSSAELRWTKPKVMTSVATNYSLFYSLHQCKSIIMGTTIPLYVITCCHKSHVHTRIAQSMVFKIIFQDLISWAKMFIGCLSPVGRFPSVRANNFLKLTLEIKIFCAATLELVYKLLTGPPQKRKCFSEISW